MDLLPTEEQQQIVDEALLFVELGRNLLPPSVLGSVLAAHIGAQCGATTHLPRILEGDLKIALATPRAVRTARIGASTDGEFLVYCESYIAGQAASRAL